ncbi:hypothetical protein HYW60_02660 [Candidatus Kaiserbacteria bacterium]|nr:hypothetical protein [Candidatus Kaiserbacteria bacterium]
MRNPFRKKSPEEEFVDSFLKGMTETMGDNQEAKDMYALIKSRRDSGDYIAVQELANNFVQAAGALHRAEKDRKLMEELGLDEDANIKEEGSR